MFITKNADSSQNNNNNNNNKHKDSFHNIKCEFQIQIQLNDDLIYFYLNVHLPKSGMFWHSLYFQVSINQILIK